ncbi:MAG: ice-binding family protein [Candidatus Wallbacteria bacterium]|nr:ice-binding family protein [Candidatus Wallbacteria bacterium]
MKFHENVFVSFLLLIVLLAGCFGDSGSSGGSSLDTTPPTVSSTMSPTADLGTGMAINGNISAAFNEKMNPATITTSTFTLMQGAALIPCAVSYSGLIASLNPAADLAPGTVYTATITTGAKDLAGNSMAADKTWSITTGAAADNTAPTVSYTSPVNAAIGVAVNSNISATFSEWMDPATITTSTFTLKQGVVPFLCDATYAGTVATLNPISDLTPGTTYTATVSAAVRDLAGNTMAANKSWSFTTGAAAAKGPAPVDLGTAGNFVILSKAGISTVPNSALTGDIGVSPISAGFITGFSLTLDASTTYSTSGQLNGKAYAADYSPPTPSNLTTAVSNMETAYTDAAGRTQPTATELGSGNISGLTIPPGLYKWGTGVVIASDVTLSGGPNDIWIFQISNGLTIAAGAKVILTGGALPKNIFWQAYGTVTLNAGAHIEGIVLTQTGITLATGASANGRLLAQTAVTLDQSIVTQPSP